MKFLDQNPFVRFTIYLIGGIMLGEYLREIEWLPYAFLISFITLTIFHSLAHRTNLYYKIVWSTGLSIAIFMVALGCWLTQNAYQNTQTELFGQEAWIQARIVDEPTEKPRSVMCKVEIEHYKGSTETNSSHGKLILYLAKDSASTALETNDAILFYTQLTPTYRSHNPTTFDYAQYLSRKGYITSTYISADHWRKIDAPRRESIRQKAQKCQRWLLDKYNKHGITADEYGVLSALTLGHRDELDEATRVSYSRSGAMHILAVSGLHIGIIYFVLGLIIRIPKRLKFVKTLVIILLLWSYAFITGLSPSVVRATIMFSVLSIGQITHQASSSYNRIGVSAFFLLVSDPLLLFDVGFQLSYAAVISIVSIYPRLHDLWKPRLRITRWAWNLTCVSLAAQVGVFPLLVLYFQQFATYFLLTNFVAVPLAGCIIYTSCLFFAFTEWEVVANLIAYILNKEVSLLNWSIRGIEGLPSSVMECSINNTQTIMIYTIILLVCYSWTRRKISGIYCALGCLIAVIGIQNYRQYVTHNSECLIIYAENRHLVIQQTKGINSCVTTDSIEAAEELTHSYTLLRGLTPSKIVWLNDSSSEKTLADGAFIFNKKTYLSINSTCLAKTQSQKPLMVDNVILGKIGHTTFRTLMSNIETQRIIALNTFPYWLVTEYEKGCRERGIEFHNTRTQGAWIEEVRWDQNTEK